jgi:hypothetical protein
MRNRVSRTLHTILLISALVVVGGLGMLVGVASSAPSTQGSFPEPTPTPYPGDPTAYTVSSIDPAEATTTWPAVTENGITISETTITASYPEGATFTTTIDSDRPLGAMVLLLGFIEFEAGDNPPGVIFDANTTFPVEVSVTIPNRGPAAPNSPFFMPFGTVQARWAVLEPLGPTRGRPGVALETQLRQVRYIDTTRDWQRISSNGVAIYALNTGDLSADDVGMMLAEMTTSTLGAALEAYQIEELDSLGFRAFGLDLNFGSHTILYPDQDMWEADGSPGPLLETVQDGFFFFSTSTTTVLDAPTPDCAYFADGEGDFTRYQFLINNRLSQQLINAINAFTGQIAANFGFGSDWWNNGLEIYFAAGPIPYNEVTQSLAASGAQFVPLSEGTPLLRYPPGSVFEGCDSPVGLIGASFINWLVSRTNLAVLTDIIVQVRSTEQTPIEVLEATFGDDFVNIENAWRSTMGLPPVSLSQIDPIAALQPAPTALLNVGDTLAVPGFGPLPLVNVPGDPLSSGAACFPGGTIEVLQRGLLDGVVWYQVECQTLTGWISEGDLIP